MKKLIVLIIMCLAIAASPAIAQEKQPAADAYQLGAVFDSDIHLGYRWVGQHGSPKSGEYEDLHSSVAGQAIIEWDPLPHRFLLETYNDSSRDYFSEMDYSYSDVVMLNMLTRKFSHNFDHLSLGADDPATQTPRITDLSPNDRYTTETGMTRAQIRFKLPDYPFHIYLEAKNQDKHGDIQQRFYEAFSGGFNKMSRTREIDWETNEARATVNSHLGPLEIEYSHAIKKFEDTKSKVMTDTVVGSPTTFDHNLVPTLESSSDSIKVHTSHTGRIAAAATYANGEKESKDSNTKSTFWNAAGDLTLIPWKELTVSFKYRHFDVNEDTPDFATLSGVTGYVAGAGDYAVRNAINYHRDLVSGLVRFRATENLTVRAEYVWESQLRDVWPGYDSLTTPLGTTTAYWTEDERVVKGTARLGATYRFTSRFLFRGDVSHQTADIPANSTDNTYFNTTDQARASLTWNPKPWVSMLLSGGTIQEKRDQLAAPQAGEKTAERDRALASVTFLLGRKTSITPSYAYFRNAVTSSVAYTDATGGTTAETGVPYADEAHLVSISMTHAVTDMLSVTAEAGRSWSRGNWITSEIVPGSIGIPQLTNLKVVETYAGGEVQVDYTKNLGTEFRYQVRKTDDILDNAQDGTTQIALATLSWKW